MVGNNLGVGRALSSDDVSGSKNKSTSSISAAGSQHLPDPEAKEVKCNCCLFPIISMPSQIICNLSQIHGRNYVSLFFTALIALFAFEIKNLASFD